jgi:hypothetical protein
LPIASMILLKRSRASSGPVMWFASFAMGGEGSDLGWQSRRRGSVTKSLCFVARLACALYMLGMFKLFDAEAASRRAGQLHRARRSELVGSAAAGQSAQAAALA